MKFRFLQFCLLMFFVAGAVSVEAQTALISSGGFVAVSGQVPGTPVSTENMIGQPIAANLQFGDVSPNGIQSRRVVMRMPIRISADCNYKVELQRISFNSASIQPSDIGFGIGNARPQIGGSPNLTANAAEISIIGNFAANPIIAPVVNGLPRFQNTLAGILENPTPVFYGVPTMAGGTAGDDSNSILVDLTFVIVPQYYTPTDSARLNVILTITPR